MEESNNKMDFVLNGQKYPIIVTEDEKARVQHVEETLNARLSQFKKMFTNLSQEDCLALLLITFGFELDKLQIDLRHKDTFIENLDKILTSKS